MTAILGSLRSIVNDFSLKLENCTSPLSNSLTFLLSPSAELGYIGDELKLPPNFLANACSIAGSALLVVSISAVLLPIVTSMLPPPLGNFLSLAGRIPYMQPYRRLPIQLNQLLSARPTRKKTIHQFPLKTFGLYNP